MWHDGAGGTTTGAGLAADGYSTFASFRLMGAGLDPIMATERLWTEPEVSYRTGDAWLTRTTGTLVRRKTNLWLARSPRTLGPAYRAHLDWATEFLGRRAEAIRSILETGGVEMDVSAFWHGPHGMPHPTGDEPLAWLVARLGGTFERDHSTDEVAWDS